MIGVYMFGGILLLLIVVVVFAAIRSSVPDPGEGRQLTQVELRDVALEALRELEFDYQTGKLPEEEYQTLRAELGLAAVRAREAVERTRTPRTAEKASGSGDKVTCRVCGTEVVPEANFCAACGAPREAPA
jgi:rubrerythrin